MKRSFFLLGLLILFINAQSQTINIYPSVEYQTITGFGGHNPNGEVSLLVNDMGMSVHRSWFNYDFEPNNDNNDPDVVNTSEFDFSKATNTSIADLIDLKNAGVETFIASIWSPPAWMKVNNSTSGDNATSNKLKATMYDELAEYCTQFAKEFEANIGIKLYALSIQNEPRFAQTFPSCVYEPDELRDAIKAVGLKMEEEGLDTKIFAAEDMGSYGINSQWFNSILGDTVSRRLTDIWAVHGYQDGVNATGDATGWEQIYNKVSSYDMPVWMTETSGYAPTWEESYVNLGGNESGDKPGAIDLAHHIYLALKYGKISAWVWWRININEDEVGYWLDECLVHGGTPEKGYYASKQYYKFIRPGAKMVKSVSDNDSILVTAYKNGNDATLSLVILNMANSDQSVSLNSDNAPSQYNLYRSSATENCADLGTVSSSITLPARSVSTLVYNGTNHTPTINKINDTLLLADPGEVTIQLYNISDGGDGGQTISITPTNKNLTLIPDLSVDYTQGNSNATLRYTPATGESGLDTITLSITDNGDNTGGLHQTSVSFVVRIIPFVNNAPNIDQVNDIAVPKPDGFSQQTFQLTGINDGDDGSQNISFYIENADANVVKFPSVSYSSGNTATFTYVPYSVGTTTITLTLKDDGGTWLGGEDETAISFDLTLEENLSDGQLLRKQKATLNIYPNPAKDMISVVLPSMQQGELAIYNINGKQEISRMVQGNKTMMKLDVNALKPGLYYVLLYSGKGTFRKPFIVE